MTVLERITRIEVELRKRIERAEKATPGPWEAAEVWSSSDYGDYKVRLINPDVAEVFEDCDQPFIAAARTEHPQAHMALLKVLRRLWMRYRDTPHAEYELGTFLAEIERELELEENKGDRLTKDEVKL